jgi:lipopolysaccharide/colanic/teichoic acid biosynthesis glycosyltransferase
MVQPNLTRSPYEQRPAGRLGEWLVASVLLILTLPLIVIVAVAIKCESAEPIFVRQSRLGAAGEYYVAVKFRTTREGGQTPENGGQAGLARYMTRLGWFLRQTRIENLPQLVNVFRGEMSCINPRFGCPFFLD